jgi:hypothetical protein
MITSNEIRKQLRQFDSPYPWGLKISKTPQLLDPKYHLLTLSELRWLVREAIMGIANYMGVSEESLPGLWVQFKHDCDDFAGQMVSFSNMAWAKKEGTTLPPAVFRIIAELSSTIHAYNMAFTDNGIWFADLTVGVNIWSIDSNKPKIIGFG